jgi:hypothetical protein
MTTGAPYDRIHELLISPVTLTPYGWLNHHMEFLRSKHPQHYARDYPVIIKNQLALAKYALHVYVHQIECYKYPFTAHEYDVIDQLQIDFPDQWDAAQAYSLRSYGYVITKIKFSRITTPYHFVNKEMRTASFKSYLEVQRVLKLDCETNARRLAMWLYCTDTPYIQLTKEDYETIEQLIVDFPLFWKSVEKQSKQTFGESWSRPKYTGSNTQDHSQQAKNRINLFDDFSSFP